MGPGPRIEPESRDPQSRRITTILPRHLKLMNILIEVREQGFEPWEAYANRS